MRHVNALGSELARHALRDSPECEFRRGKIDETRSTPQGCGGAGEDDGALSGLGHAPRRLTPDQEAREAPDPPTTLEFCRIGFAHHATLIGADIEDHEPRNAERTRGMVEERVDLARGSSVTIAQLNRWQRLELGEFRRAAGGRHDDHPLIGKATYQR